MSSEPPQRRIPKTLWLILALALALRLLGAYRANLIFDERAHWALAETIDLSPGHLHLVSRTLDHPLLSIYVLKFGSLLLGTSDFALRMLHLLAGTLTVVPVYFLTRRAFSERAGLFAAALLAVDQFHASWSRVFMPEVLLLLFGSLALLQFLRMLEKPTVLRHLVLGLLLGLAYLAKTPGVLLIPALWIYLALSPKRRCMLWHPHWYFTQFVFLLVIAPDVMWNSWQFAEGHLGRSAALAAEPWQLSLKPLSLYLGEVFRVLIDPGVLDEEYAHGHVYACHWIAGLLYLIAVVAAGFARRGDSAVRVLLVTFWLIFVFFLLVPGGQRFEPFWWASLSLIPAVACGGWLLDWVCRRGAFWRATAVALPCLLAVLYLPAAWWEGPYQPRAGVEDFVDDFLGRAKTATVCGDLLSAQRNYIYVLNISGPNAQAYEGLAHLAIIQRQPEKAEPWLAKRRALEAESEE